MMPENFYYQEYIHSVAALFVRLHVRAHKCLGFLLFDLNLIVGLHILSINLAYMIRSFVFVRE